MARGASQCDSTIWQLHCAGGQACAAARPELKATRELEDAGVKAVFAAVDLEHRLAGAPSLDQNSLTALIAQLQSRRQEQLIGRLVHPTATVTAVPRMQFATRALVALLSLPPSAYSSEVLNLVATPLRGIRAVRPAIFMQCLPNHAAQMRTCMSPSWRALLATRVPTCEASTRQHRWCATAESRAGFSCQAHASGVPRQWQEALSRHRPAVTSACPTAELPH